MNEAALLATRRGAPEVALQDFNEGIERIVAGLEKKNRLLNEKERRTWPTTRWGTRSSR